MRLESFKKAISAVVELQSIADNEIRRLKDNQLETTCHEITEEMSLASTLSCRISDVYCDLMEYVSHEVIKE